MTAVLRELAAAKPDHLSCGCPMCTTSRQRPDACPTCCHVTTVQGHRPGCPENTTRKA
ncbi:hypothetical protein [Auraticoccus monumenti]|uniref:Uncharacterized protein n=1 Tax=Auraticoccus monumenti TaxID=675864 RepID=A0A1G6UQ18_9ACTN|nr:hypothetical protein [Auraticoccus monumenti]SDD43401.1 hypothetical protein SAMN04489747_0939 [Auraticoccus monumenti]